MNTSSHTIISKRQLEILHSANARKQTPDLGAVCLLLSAFSYVGWLTYWLINN